MLVTECASLMPMSPYACLAVSASCFLVLGLTGMPGGAGTCRAATSSRCVRQRLGVCSAVQRQWHAGAGCSCTSPDRAPPSSGHCA